MPTYTATEAQAGIQPKGLRVGCVAVTSLFSFPASGSTAMTVLMVKVPANATPVMGWVSNNNAGQLTVQVGDGMSPARYYAETTLSSAMGAVAFFSNTTPAAWYSYSTDDTIDIVISRVSVSTLGGAMYMTVIFSMDVN